MELLWPVSLLALVVVPLLVAVYIWLLRRRRVALRYFSLSLVRAALPRFSRWRRHVPFALFLLAICSLVVALARPVRVVAVPTGQATILLAMDVSGSMRQANIVPTRIEAAQQAALSFIQRQKASTQIGIVAFADYAELIQPPTNDQDALRVAVESLTLGRGTAIGDGILASLDAIAGVDHSVALSVPDPSSPDEPPPPPQGTHVPHIVVLLTDGVANTGMPPLDAAREAADRGVRVFTIGFGTAQGSPNFGGPGFFGNGSGQGQSGNGFGQGQSGNGFGQGPAGSNGGFGGGRFRRGIDEATLKKIATMTGAAYYSASSAGELLKVFQNLPTSLITKHETTEISVLFAAIGAVLAAMAIGLSLRWQPLP